ncbi:MAG: YdbH domain-containing protein [Sphingobium sp.]|nr:YdbH domain-containing protein [Sphingobium sp.]MCP5398516.1 YdbH domain-containing protein [Sphingomonas sp.]
MTGPETGEYDAEVLGSARLQRTRAILLIFAICVSVVTIFIWTQRQPIAERFVDDALAERDVRATYEIKQIALRTQRIENLVLGDPAHPDLTADSVEIDLAYGSIIPRVGAVRARGVRLYGKVDENGLSLGELDKLRDPSSTAPFNMPDIDLTLDDARARLATPAGDAGLSLRGSGNLRSGFTGKVGALIRNAAMAGCRSPQASAYLDVAMTGGAPHFSGPLRLNGLRCADKGIVAAQLVMKSDMTLSPQLDSWRGRVNGEAKALRIQGATLASPALDMRFDGSSAKMQGEGDLKLAALGYGDIRAGASKMTTRWSWADGKIQADGGIEAASPRVMDVRALHAMAAKSAQTPVGPLAAKLADALSSMQSGGRMRGRYALTQQAGAGSLNLSSLEWTGSRGGQVALGNGGSVAIDIPNGRWALNGSIVSRGAGLPEMALRLRSAPGGGLSGQMFLQPYEARGARLESETVRFVARPDGMTRIETKLRLDGPMPDGFVRGLDLPVQARWNGGSGFVLNPECAPVRFTVLKAGAMELGANSLRLCPVDGGVLVSRGGRLGGGARIDAPRLEGRMGDTRLRLAARSADYRMGSGRFSLAGVSMHLGGDKEPVLLSADSLDGGTVQGGMGGNASGITARIGTVPLLVRDGEAAWSYSDGVLGLNGPIIVYDDANPDRFHPLQSPDFLLRLANGRIDAAGSLRVPGRERTIATVNIYHVLDSGVGYADLIVDALRFDGRLQPDEITPIALGVVANVFGTVDGRGRIDWTPAKVTSTGDFTTEDMDLAAAFGPVDGLSTHIHFTDLIGLVTAPGQEMRLASTNPGIEVRDGVIRYALLPDQRVAIEGGRWPFAQGELTLLPTIMDMSSEKPRRMAFRVIGLEAGAFIQKLELENISATGTFDGLLPMVFDASGGRIVGGILNARQHGMPPLVVDHIEGLDIPCDPDRQAGNLAYVGQVSNENLGRMGKLAFDALKDLQYKCLTILMDGAIDGEVVTQVAFNGINRGKLSTVPKPIATQFVGLPFIFNIKIEAPFRGLMNTARSFTDPSMLIRQHLGNDFAPVVQNRLAVQPSESENMPSGDKE